MKMYVHKNSKSPATSFFSSNYHPAIAAEDLIEIEFPEFPGGDVRPVATLGEGIWVGVWQPLTAQMRLDELAATQVRSKRQALLNNSDWTQVADAPVDREAWATYRQALRDISNQASFPYNIEWPVAP